MTSPSSRLEPGERLFLAAIACSLIGHLVIVGLQLIRLKGYKRPVKLERAMDLVYEHDAPSREARALHEPLAYASRRSDATPSASAAALQVRLPERVSVGGSAVLGGLGSQGPSAPLAMGSGRSASLPDIASPSRAAVVDLTNIVEAAQGDPVLLSYFSAIRERIQQAANHRAWFSGESAEGLVYVAFVMSSVGQVQSVSIVADRSAASRALQDIAVNIIKAASPFPPFPPSFNMPSKTIVVPLEFLLGGAS